MANKTSVWKWIAASFEEKEGRSSGKSITAFVLVVLFVLCTVYICFRPYWFSEDIRNNEYKILEVCVDGIVWIVLGLYSVKAVGSSRFFSSSKKEETTATNTETNEPK